MIVEPAIYLPLLLGALCLYWSISPVRPKARASALLASSFLIISLVSLFAAVIAASAALFAASASRLIVRRNQSLPITLGAVVAIGSLLVIARLAVSEIIDLNVIDLFGAAFFVLKSIAIVADAYRFGRTAGWLDALLLNLFFPIFSAGPVELPNRFNTGAAKVSLSADDLLIGVGRILIGIFKQSFLAAIVVESTLARVGFADGTEAAASGAAGFAVWLMLKWLFLYLSFAGYTDVAVGSGRLFGFELLENFNRPWAARNIQEFWQRWHISLINFMSNYVYKPLVRKTGYRYRGIFALFLFAGLWHALTIQYAIWGLLHASALVALAKWQRSEWGRMTDKWLTNHPAVAMSAAGASRLTTLLFVAWVSAVGQSATLGEAGAILTFGILR